jgi:hypothetical protein
MSKIKDLATVTVDVAFRLFPIDQERYELLACVGNHTLRVYDEQYVSVSDSGNDAINEFMRQTDANFLSAATAFQRTCSAGFPRNLPTIVEDRSRRFEATVNRSTINGMRATRVLSNKPLWACVAALWEETYREMLLTRGFVNRSPYQGHGAQS